MKATATQPQVQVLDMLLPIRNWIDSFSVNNITLATLICQVIPAACPFARTLHFFGYTLEIPPLCKINPLYEQLMGLRFRALVYLDDQQ